MLTIAAFAPSQSFFREFDSDTMALTSDELEAYWRDGFLVKKSVFSERECEILRMAAERSSAAAIELSNDSSSKPYHLDGNRFVDCSKTRGGHLTVQFEHQKGSSCVRVIEPVNELDNTFDALIDDQRLVLPMKQLVGSDALSLWTAKLNLKRPKDFGDLKSGGSGFGWHQDSPYWVFDCKHTVDALPNVMVLFDDAAESNGCLRVIRGSHRKGCLPARNDGSQLGGLFTHPSEFSEDDQVPMVAPAGSIVFFNAHTVHGSQPNTSFTARRAIILTYQPANFAALKSGQIRNVALRSTARL